MLAEVKCTVYLLPGSAAQSAGKQGSAFAQRNTWEDKYSVVLLIIFKLECISTWWVFDKERSGDRKMKEIY